MSRIPVARRVLLSAFVSMVLLVGVATAASPLRLVSDPWPPFTGAEGQPRLVVDLVHEALARAGHEAETSIIEAAAVMPALQAGEYDGSAALWRGEEREAFMLYSEAYLENRLVLVGRTGSDVSATRFADIAGRRLAVVGTYSYGAALEGEPGPVLVPGADLQENLTRLLAGEVDYMLVDELVIAHIRQHYPDEAAERLAIGSKALITRTLHFTLREDVPGVEAIMVAFNREILAMLADGSYNRVLGLEWIRADIDGDGRLDYVHAGGAIGPERPSDSFAVMALVNPQAEQEGEGSFYLAGRNYQDWDQVPHGDRDPARYREKEDAAGIFELEF